MKATYVERTAKVGYQDVHLVPGEFIFGRHKASQETGLSERKIRTAIDSLRKRQNLTIKTTNKYSIISIVNWAIYQDETTSNMTSKRPANDQQTTTDKKVKKDKNIKKGIYGEFKNVKLTDEEYQKLIDKVNSKLPKLIEALSSYNAG